MAYTDRQWNSVSKQCDSQNSLNSSQFPDGLLEYWFRPTVIFVPVNSISGTQVSAFPPLLSTAIAEIIQEPINIQRNEKEGQGYSPSPKCSSPASAKGQGWAENHRNSRGWIYFSRGHGDLQSHGREFQLVSISHEDNLLLSCLFCTESQLY